VFLAALFGRWRERDESEVPALRFDDLPEPAVATLGLSGE